MGKRQPPKKQRIEILPCRFFLGDREIKHISEVPPEVVAGWRKSLSEVVGDWARQHPEEFRAGCECGLFLEPEEYEARARREIEEAKAAIEEAGTEEEVEAAVQKLRRAKYLLAQHKAGFEPVEYPAG